MAIGPLLALAQLFCLLVSFDPPKQTAAESPPAQSPTKAGDHTAGARTPEQTIKAFLIAMFDKDQDAVRRTTLPNPDLALLWQGDALTPAQRAMAMAELESWHFRRLKVGDEVQLPGGKKLVIDEKRVNDRRLMITVTDSPLPFLLVKVGEEWKVDARPVIAGRKAAAAARQRGATQKEPGTK
jgi:hypothetical protein